VTGLGAANVFHAYGVVAVGRAGNVTESTRDHTVQPGGTLMFPGSTTYDFHGTTITGKSGVTLWARWTGQHRQCSRGRHQWCLRLLRQF
jgi:hypothetical protein